MFGLLVYIKSVILVGFSSGTAYYMTAEKDTHSIDLCAILYPFIGLEYIWNSMNFIFPKECVVYINRLHV